MDETATDKAVAAERERCAAIVQLAREGELDTDFRSIIHMIKSGFTPKEATEDGD